MVHREISEVGYRTETRIYHFHTSTCNSISLSSLQKSYLKEVIYYTIQLVCVLFFLSVGFLLQQTVCFF